MSSKTLYMLSSYWPFVWYLFLALVAWLVWKGLKSRQLDDHPHCANCLYDLSGLEEPERCPECGANTAIRGGIVHGRTKRRYHLAVLAVPIAAGFLYTDSKLAQALHAANLRPLQIQKAAAADDVSSLQRLLRLEPHLLKSSSFMNHLLTDAITDNADRCFDLLMDMPEVRESVLTPMPGRSLLGTAVHVGNEHAIVRLIRARAPLENGFGEHIVYTAAVQNSAMLSVLKSEGIDFTARHKDGYTPFHRLFLAWSDYRAIKSMLEHVDIDVADSRGDTALHIVMKKSDYERIWQLLCLGADLTVRNKQGLTPSQVGLEGENPFVVAQIWDRLLRDLVRQGKGEHARMLIRSESLLLQPADRYTPYPFNLARRSHFRSDDPERVAEHCTKVLDILFEEGFPVNERDPAGNTLLHIAADDRNEELVTYLISRGADETLVDKQLRTAADMWGAGYPGTKAAGQLSATRPTTVPTRYDALLLRDGQPR